MTKTLLTTSLTRRAGLAALAGAAALASVAGLGATAAFAADKTSVKVGIMSGEDEDVWRAAAAEAEKAGLVARVVAADMLVPEALAAADQIAAKSLLAVMAAKEAVHRADEVSLSEGVLFERRLFQALFATEDQKEGMRAFLDKRPPVFTDK